MIYEAFHPDEAQVIYAGMMFLHSSDPYWGVLINVFEWRPVAKTLIGIFLWMFGFTKPTWPMETPLVAGIQPPLPTVYYLPLDLTGSSIPQTALFAARLTNVFLGACSCVLVLYFGKKFFNWKSGVFASLILAFNPAFLAYSRQALLDMACAFFSIASIGLFYLASRRRETNVLTYVLAGTSFALAVGSKEFGLITLTTIVAWFFISLDWRCSKRRYLGLVFFILASLLTYIITSPTLVYCFLMEPQKFHERLSFILAVRQTQMFQAQGVRLFDVNWPGSIQRQTSLPELFLLISGLTIILWKIKKRASSNSESLALMWFLSSIGFSLLFIDYTHNMVVIAPPLALICAEITTERWGFERYWKGVFGLIILLHIASVYDPSYLTYSTWTNPLIGYANQIIVLGILAAIFLLSIKTKQKAPAHYNDKGSENH